MVVGPPLAGIWTVGAVDRREQGIFSAGLQKAHLYLLGTDAHGLAGDVAGGAAAPVGSQALKKRPLLVHTSVEVQGRCDAARVGERLQAERLTERRRLLSSGGWRGNDNGCGEQRRAQPDASRRRDLRPEAVH